MKLTVEKADGPGWKMIAELVHEGKYKIVTERVSKEPQFEVILKFLHRLPHYLDKVIGVEAQQIVPIKQISAKRAARLASRELDKTKGQYVPSKSVQIKGTEMEDAYRTVKETREIAIWVKPGKKRTTFRQETFKGMEVLEVTTALSDKQTNQVVIAALKKRFNVFEGDIEMIEGYNSQCKKYRVTLRSNHS